MRDNQSLKTHKKAELERFSHSEHHPMTIESHEDQISIIQFWRVLQKRRWLVIGSLAAVVLLVTAVSLVLPKRYEASSRLLLDLEGPGDLGLEQIVMPMGLDMNTKLET